MSVLPSFARAPFGRLHEGALEGQLAGLIERPPIDALTGRRQAVHVGPHELGDDLFAHQIPSGPNSSSGGGGASGPAVGGEGAGGDSFRMSSNVVEYRRRRASLWSS